MLLLQLFPSSKVQLHHLEHEAGPGCLFAQLSAHWARLMAPTRHDLHLQLATAPGHTVRVKAILSPKNPSQINLKRCSVPCSVKELRTDLFVLQMANYVAGLLEMTRSQRGELGMSQSPLEKIISHFRSLIPTPCFQGKHGHKSERVEKVSSIQHQISSNLRAFFIRCCSHCSEIRSQTRVLETFTTCSSGQKLA